MRVYMMFLVLMFVVGCERPAYLDAPSSYRCDRDQMARVESETVYCFKNTSIGSMECYGDAFVRNCVKIGGKDDAAQIPKNRSR